jgi:hypothetical protein
VSISNKREALISVFQKFYGSRVLLLEEIFTLIEKEKVEVSSKTMGILPLESDKSFCAGRSKMLPSSSAESGQLEISCTHKYKGLSKLNGVVRIEIFLFQS